MRLQHRSQVRGFTLVEMLVVVSIISILLAILVPALGDARASARQVYCNANLRIFGLAHFTYANTENDWAVPYDYWNSSTGEAVRWFNNSAMQANMGFETSFSSWDTDQWGDLVCPDAPSEEAIGGNVRYAYGMNYSNPITAQHNGTDTYPVNSSKVWNTPDGTDLRVAIRGYKFSKVSNASQKVLMADAVQERVSAWKSQYSVGYINGDVPGKSGTDSATAYRHRNFTANVLWFDGHTENINDQDLGPISFWQRRQMWAPYFR